MMPEIRAILQKTIFSNIREISEENMATINYGIYKVLALKPGQELAEEEFYESVNEMQFMVHKYNQENVELDALVTIYYLISHFFMQCFRLSSYTSCYYASTFLQKHSEKLDAHGKDIQICWLGNLMCPLKDGTTWKMKMIELHSQ